MTDVALTRKMCGTGKLSWEHSIGKITIISWLTICYKNESAGVGIVKLRIERQLEVHSSKLVDRRLGRLSEKLQIDTTVNFSASDGS